MNYKLELHNFAVDGRVKDIKEDSSRDFFNAKIKQLKFDYLNKKLCCFSEVIFETTDEKVDLYKLAVTFVKRLK